jgi:hypothetical protein
MDLVKASGYIDIKINLIIYFNIIRTTKNTLQQQRKNNNPKTPKRITISCYKKYHGLAPTFGQGFRITEGNHPPVGTSPWQAHLSRFTLLELCVSSLMHGRIHANLLCSFQFIFELKIVTLLTICAVILLSNFRYRFYT